MSSLAPPACHKILSDEQVAQFLRDGYLIMPGFFDAQEAAILRQTTPLSKSMPIL